MNICPKCGLPLQACMCEEIAKSEQHIKIELVKRKYGKIATLITGLSGVDIKNIAKELKGELACGGTTKNNVIELQGDHHKRVKPVLVRLGFPETSISE